MFTPLVSGLSNPMTSTGDIIYSSDNSGTPARLAKSTDNKVLTLSGGLPSWQASTAAPAYTYVSQSSTLNPAALGSYYLLSGSSFTITLPTAVGVAGQTVAFQHNGTSGSQLYTFNTTSAQTIGGVASGSYVLHTNSEALILVSDGANWQIISHRTTTAWASYTPTFVGLGTVASVSIYSMREGPNLLIRGTFTTGTVTASTASMTIGVDGVSANETTDGGVLSSTQGIGFAYVGTVVANNAKIVSVLSNGTSTTINFSTANDTNTVNPNSAQTGSAAFLNSAVYTINISVPILGWRP